MSETCPNCGSRKDMFRSNNGYVQYVCRYAADKDEEWTSETCDLIRSLREELAAARDAERDRIERLEEALDQSVHALRWLHYHGMTSEFENKRKAAYDLARPLLEARGVEATNE